MSVITLKKRLSDIANVAVRTEKIITVNNLAGFDHGEKITEEAKKVYTCHKCGKEFEMMADVWMMANADGTVLMYFPVKGGKQFVIKAPAVNDSTTPRFCSKKCLIDSLIEMEMAGAVSPTAPVTDATTKT